MQLPKIRAWEARTRILSFALVMQATMDLVYLVIFALPVISLNQVRSQDHEVLLECKNAARFWIDDFVGV